MRDYSSQAMKHRRGTNRGPRPAIGITLSLVVIAVVAVGLIWLTQHTEDQVALPIARPAPTPTPQVTPPPPVSARPDAALAPIQEPPNAPPNHFTFYEILVKNEVSIDVAPAESREEAIEKQLQSTLVQVASFRNASDAESTRVELLLLNMQARIIPASGDNGGWHRVVVGPFTSVRDLESAKDRLAKNGHDFLQIQVR
jgi:cell division protein FtsN